MIHMKPIETCYRGFRFRSRLEARWAVFMDAMGVKYEYEPEAYDLDGLLYLPDFWLPEMKAHLEIKAQAPTDSEMEKAMRLSEHTLGSVFVMFGQPQVPEFANDASYESAYKLGICVDYDWFPGWDYQYWWCECPHCHRCELQFSGRADRIKCGCPKSPHGDKGYNFQSDRLLSAYYRARGYRFEPGANNR